MRHTSALNASKSARVWRQQMLFVISNLRQQHCGHPWSSHCLWCITVRLPTFREIKTYGLTLVHISLSQAIGLMCFAELSLLGLK